jgi:hypothetical protein
MIIASKKKNGKLVAELENGERGYSIIGYYGSRSPLWGDVSVAHRVGLQPALNKYRRTVRDLEKTHV